MMPSRDIVSGHATLASIMEPLLVARQALREQLAVLDGRVREVARADAVCRRLMPAPGVGAVIALTFRAAVDDPSRFRSSKSIGPCFGLTPRKYQSGEMDRNGGISRAGDPTVRVALFEAAHGLAWRSGRGSRPGQRRFSRSATLIFPTASCDDHAPITDRSMAPSRSDLQPGTQ